MIRVELSMQDGLLDIFALAFWNFKDHGIFQNRLGKIKGFYSGILMESLNSPELYWDGYDSNQDDLSWNCF